MKPDLLHILQHSLGVDKYGHGEQYRNRFVTGPGSKDFNDCNELVGMGMMEDFGVQPMCSGMHCFCVTPKGIDAMIFASPLPPKRSRSALRYREYLKQDCAESFGEWLRIQKFRKEAA